MGMYQVTKGLCCSVSAKWEGPHSLRRRSETENDAPEKAGSQCMGSPEDLGQSISPAGTVHLVSLATIREMCSLQLNSTPSTGKTT